MKSILTSPQPVGGVNVLGFLTVPEDAQIGVFAHELGHLLFEWPDLYDTDYSSEGIGNWCLMAGGCWGFIGGNPHGSTPCHPSAWCKAQQNWIDLKVEANDESLRLFDVMLEPYQVSRLWARGHTTSLEYFLVENRQLTGFDSSLPGSGLLGTREGFLCSMRVTDDLQSGISTMPSRPVPTKGIPRSLSCRLMA